MTAASSVRREVYGASATPRLHRVLFACSLGPGQKFGSLEEQIFELALAMRERGGLLLPVYSGPLSAQAAEHYRRAGLTVDSMILQRFDTATLRRLLAVVKRERIDLIHWNFYETLKNPYLWCLTALKPGLRHRFTEHNSRFDPAYVEPPEGVRGRVKKLLMRRYEKIYGVSDYVLQTHVSSYPTERTARWRYFVNADRFCPSPEQRSLVRSELGIPDSRFVVVVVANLIPWKGVDVAIRALGRLPGDSELWVVGSGAQERSCRELARSLNLTDRVRFFGMTYDVAPKIQAADCLSCPSIWGEAVGLVNLEGMACGVPVVASAVGGIPEFLHDGENGLLVPPGDVAELATAYARLAADDALRSRLGKAARASVLQDHCAETGIKNQIAEYTLMRGR